MVKPTRPDGPRDPAEDFERASFRGCRERFWAASSTQSSIWLKPRSARGAVSQAVKSTLILWLTRAAIIVGLIVGGIILCIIQGH